LRYANRAKNIKNCARINEDPKDALLRMCQKEIEELRKQLQEAGLSSDSDADEGEKKKNKKRGNDVNNYLFIFLLIYDFRRVGCRNAS